MPATGLADLNKRRPMLVGQLRKLVTAHQKRIGRVETAAAAQFALLNVRRGAASTQTRNRPPTVVGGQRKCVRLRCYESFTQLDRGGVLRVVEHPAQLQELASHPLGGALLPEPVGLDPDARRLGDLVCLREAERQ